MQLIQYSGLRNMGTPHPHDEQKEETPHFASVRAPNLALGLFLINEALVLA